jgi:hypothetical protein
VLNFVLVFPGALPLAILPSHLLVLAEMKVPLNMNARALVYKKKKAEAFASAFNFYRTILKSLRPHR